MDVCAAADKATKKAKDTGEAKDHAAAASAHDKAAKASFKAGDPQEAKRHTAAASKHRSKGGESESTDDGNPLMEWAKHKKG